MFEQLLKELDKLGGQLTIPVEKDEEGNLDKECPSESCLFLFKIDGDDWINIVRDEEVFCPSCGHAAPADQWWPRQQLEQAQKYAIDHVKGRLASAMHEDARTFNRRQPRKSFISLNLKVKADVPVLMPIRSAEPMRLRTCCKGCGCRYSYIGAAFFCPSCGQNSAVQTFAQMMKSIRAAVGVADAIRAALSKDDAEVTIRALREKSLQDVVTSFQRLAERLYAEISPNKPLRRNVFQSLSAGSAVWECATGRSYSQLLTQDELSRLGRYFQQRHLLSHQQGIVDEDYLSQTNDVTYSVGQRLIIRDEGVLEAASLTEKLAAGLISSANRQKSSGTQF